MCFNPLEILFTVLIVVMFTYVWICDLLYMVSERRRIKRINNKIKENE